MIYSPEAEAATVGGKLSQEKRKPHSIAEILAKPRAMELA
jgi:hypothetical protein